MNARWWIAAAMGIVVMLALAFQIATPVELPVRDVAQRLLPREPARSTAVIAIDDASIDAIGKWPWKRTVLADIVDRAANSGARAIVLDVLLTDPDPDDPRLAQAMRRVPTIAVGVLQKGGVWRLPTATLQAASTAAHGNFDYDHDGILRRFASTKQSADRSLVALSLAAASAISGVAVPVGRSIAPQFRTRPRDIPLISAAEVIRASSIAALSGKVAFIGATAAALSDRVLTPVSQGEADAGVTIHAAATESLVRGETVRDLPPIVSGVAAALMIAAIIDTRRSRAVRLATAAVLAIAVAGGGLLLLAQSGIAAPFVTLIVCIAGSAAVIEAKVMSASLRESRLSLEEIATRLAEQRARDVESKRVLAHELKTPIASLRGLTQLLAGYDLSEPERRRVASLVESEAGKLQSMVGGLLDLERLPLRDFQASTSVIDLGDVVASRVEFLRASTDRPLMTSIEPNATVRADAALIERVVDNLVGNALKYAPASPVSIAVRSGGGAAVLEVEDQGKGIAQTDRERIFERFFRGSAAGGTEGLGLGLALVGEAVRWHRGSVSVENGSRGGALFRITLPLAEATAVAGAV